MSDSTGTEPGTDLDVAAEEPLDVNPMVHLIAPVAAIVGTMIVRKVISSAYRRATGRPAPDARDPRTPAMRAFMWTAVITTTTAIAEVAIYRLVNKVGENEA